MNTLETNPPLPPFTAESAQAKVQAAEDAWNTCDPERVSMAYTEDTQWRNRTEFINGRAEVRDFLERKWENELNYRLRKMPWCHTDNRISVKFIYEYQDGTGQWYRAYGNEQWEFAANGLMQKREASINNITIDAPSINKT
jgi:nuclear transport factor 2 (NTF2) superfamily protein